MLLDAALLLMSAFGQTSRASTQRLDCSQRYTHNRQARRTSKAKYTEKQRQHGRQKHRGIRQLERQIGKAH